MKIKENYDLQQLKQFGFEDCNDTENWDFSDCNLSDFEKKYDNIKAIHGEDVANFAPDFILDLGESRRGQFYYCFVIDRKISIYASEADGFGSSVNLPIEFIEFISDIKEYLE